MAYKMNSFEKLMIGAMKVWNRLKTWLDRDGDGDLDVDDLTVLYQAAVEFITVIGPKIKAWPNMTIGERIDAAIDYLKEQFPSVRSSIWVILEGIAYLALLIKNKV